MDHPEDSSTEGSSGGAMATEQETVNVAQCTDLLIEKLHETGDIYALRRFMSNRLTRFGWNANLRHLVVDYIKKHGPNNVNVSHMWSDLAAVALQMTPEQVKDEVKKYLDQFGQQYIEIDDTIEVTAEPDNDEKLYQVQSRNAAPEPPSGLYPPPSPSVDAHSTKYAKPPWLFLYDSPKPPNEANTTAAANGSETGESDNYESSCESPSSPYSNTPPENMTDDLGDGEQNFDDDVDDIPSPGSLDSRGETAGASRKNAAGRPYHREKERDRERKKRLEKARQRDRQQIERARAGPAIASDPVLARVPAPISTRPPKAADEKSKPKSGGPGLKVPLSPQLSVPLRQLKLDKKSLESQTSASNTSKLSPSSQQQQQPQPPTTHKTKNDSRRAAAINELVEEEEEEELMDI